MATPGVAVPIAVIRANSVTARLRAQRNRRSNVTGVTATGVTIRAVAPGSTMQATGAAVGVAVAVVMTVVVTMVTVTVAGNAVRGRRRRQKRLNP